MAKLYIIVEKRTVDVLDCSTEYAALYCERFTAEAFNCETGKWYNTTTHMFDKETR